MKFSVDSGHSFAQLAVDLKKGESVRAESGAMVSMSGDLVLESSMKGGIMGGIARKFLGGESFFLQKVSAESADGEVVFAPSYPGDIIVLDLDGSQDFLLQKQAFLAAESGVDVGTKAQNMAQGIMSGEGFFIMKASGQGQLAISSFGAIYKRTLKPGEELVVDNGHLVAWSSLLNYKISKPGKGWVSAFTSGEGVVCRFTGPGDVYIQSRNPSSFGPWLLKYLPIKSS